MAPCANANRVVRRSRTTRPRRTGATCDGCTAVQHASRCVAEAKSGETLSKATVLADSGRSGRIAAVMSRPKDDDAHDVCELTTGNVAGSRDPAKAPEAVAVAADQEQKDGEKEEVRRLEDEAETEDAYDEDELEEFEAEEKARKEENLEMPTAECPPSCGKRVRFDLSATSVHEVTPYAEIYGAHPRTFVFDVHSEMIPAARGGFVRASVGEVDDADNDDSDSSDEDGGWESWLLEQDQDDSIDERQAEGERRTSILFSRGICVPDVDEETGWESWLDSVLGSTHEQLFYDPMP